MKDYYYDYGTLCDKMHKREVSDAFELRIKNRLARVGKSEMLDEILGYSIGDLPELLDEIEDPEFDKIGFLFDWCIWKEKEWDFDGTDGMVMHDPLSDCGTLDDCGVLAVKDGEFFEEPVEYCREIKEQWDADHMNMEYEDYVRRHPY